LKAMLMSEAIMTIRKLPLWRMLFKSRICMTRKHLLFLTEASTEKSTAGYVQKLYPGYGPQ
jgi:hypothetical protein